MLETKHCDICGKVYLVPAIEAVGFWEEENNTSQVRVLRRKDTERVEHDIMQFNTCDECRQDVLDYILANAAVNAGIVAE